MESLSDSLSGEGYSCSVASTGQAAFDVIREHEIDVALIDLRLGRESGIEVLSALMSMRPSLICLMMTAYATLDSAMEAIRLGAWDHLRKPFSLPEVLAALQRSFERQELLRARSLAEAKLRRQNEQLELLNVTLLRMIDTFSGPHASGSSAGLCAVDEAGRLSFMNEAFRRSLEILEPVPLGKPLKELVAPTSQDGFALSLQSLRRGEASDRRLCFLTACDELLWIRLTAVPVIDRHGGFRGACFLNEGEETISELPIRSVERALSVFPSEPEAGPDGLEKLSRREREVHDVALGGGRAGDIAEDIGISTNTVRNHLRQIYRKLGVHSRAELSARALGGMARRNGEPRP